MGRTILHFWKWLGRWPRVQQWLLRRLHPSFLVGVVAVIFDDERRVVLFHHTYRRRYHWSLPGGWMERGEEPTEALAREIREEADLAVEVGEPLTALAGPVAPNVEVVYLARLTGGAFRPSAEVDRLEAFAVTALPELKPYQRELIQRTWQRFFGSMADSSRDG